MKSLLTILPFLFSFFETGMSAYYYTSEDVPQARCCTGAVPGNSLALVELTFYSRDNKYRSLQRNEVLKVKPHRQD